MWYCREQPSLRKTVRLPIQLDGSQRIRRTIDPPGEARVDWEITQQLAKQLDGEMNYRFAGEIAIAIAENVPGYHRCDASKYLEMQELN